ncbi:MAG: large conductance mechanosensitive channel protein MscL [Clostridia bacterium]|nr:large conductance mechanosensitive channel protein MscL [Clostridia bacterium]MBQ2738525.1 large conductance mechanosensitive channel protein MscL [Clostridia bacterium]MBQ8290248.1 large conductance mechanosensitive channel protein MscL [Clostridia bacterium]
MTKFFQEFKKFITRGNVVDMAVGVTVGSAFTAIVNGLSNNILKPIINWFLAMLLGKDSLKEIFTFLIRAEKDVLDAEGNVIGKEVDLASSIYIDWGAFINAVLNFFIIAFVLFSIVKIVNKVREDQKKMFKSIPSKADRKEMKKLGIKLHDEDAVKAYMKKKEDEAKAKEEAAKAEAAEKARLEREANPTTEDLLKMILAEIKKD